ncbi:MAG: DivIVA domain-containing protein [Clostridia bacterium]|nr:DivIVA domain-containing protein [Clostridia bacterium]
MAITVKQIRDMDFPTEKNGYRRDDVDDFLDELASQTEELAREIDALTAERDKAVSEAAALRKELAGAKQAAEAAKEQAAAVPAVKEEASAPTFNEPSYFKNLETTLRETLISAQRIADETIDDARKKARRIVSDAEEQAANTEAQAQQKLSEIRADYEQVRNAGEEYHRAFSKLVEEQNKLLKESSLYAPAE